jgi:4,5-DOPA dioxygenase extradiol
MNRRDVIKAGIGGVAGAAGTSAMRLPGLARAMEDLPPAERQPALFIGHGSPMNAIEDNDFTREWKRVGRDLPSPKAILSVSAHWLTRGVTKVTAMDEPRTIHDFGGFPRELYEQQYPAPGSPENAAAAVELVRKTHVEADAEWGLDHGTWSVLLPMFPEANVPTFQLSIDYDKPAAWHLELARELRALRRKGVLVIGSGNLVHNLGRMQPGGKVPDWAAEFEAVMVEAVDSRDFGKVADFQKLGAVARQAHPTHDHFLPLLYALGVAEDGEEIVHFNKGFDLGSISMRSLRIG